MPWGCVAQHFQHEERDEAPRSNEMPSCTLDMPPSALGLLGPCQLSAGSQESVSGLGRTPFPHHGTAQQVTGMAETKQVPLRPRCQGSE